jgi:hypothetical protein
MKVIYSRRFKLGYDELPPALQEQFRLVDAQVRNGNLDVLRRNAWVYSKAIGGGFIVWGTVTPASEFFWRDVALAAAVPIIL